MTLSFTASELPLHIDADLNTCERLLELLNLEQNALKSRDADAVEQLLDKKIPLLQQLEISSTQRKNWAQQANVSANAQAWESFISELGQVGLAEKWLRLKEYYEKIHTQNEINGRLLSRHQATVTRLLDVMRGKTATPSLYNASGYSSSTSAHGALGEA